MRQPLRALPLLLAGVMLLGGAAYAAPEARDLKQEEANRALVVDFYDRFFNQHDVSAASVVANNYKQHNPEVPDGKAPFVSFFRGFFQEHPKTSSKIVRTASSGDLVYLHVHFRAEPNERGAAVVDIFRVEKGRIVEHWDVTQEVPEKAANNNTMF